MLLAEEKLSKSASFEEKIREIASEASGRLEFFQALKKLGLPEEKIAQLIESIYEG